MLSRSYRNLWSDRRCINSMVSLVLSLVIVLAATPTVHAQDMDIGGETWVWQDPLPQSNKLLGIWGADANNVWTVGDGGVILKFDGNAWLPQDSGVDVPLRDVWGADANNAWVVGDGGVILKWDGSEWRRQSSGVISDIYGVGGADANNIWVVGNDATILKWDGGEWRRQSNSVNVPLRDIWAADANNVWAVGGDGTILKWDGGEWRRQISNVNVPLLGVWGADVSNVWAVGYGGVILKWDGSEWRSQISNVSGWLDAIWGTDANNVWTVGTEPDCAILGWGGSEWRCQYSVDVRLFNIWGADANSVWAVGDYGAMLKSNKNSPDMENSDIAPFIQGEVVYMQDGDIWLHDLTSRDARQLTITGNNLAPAWSPDGRYLVYSHGPDLESSDLYLLDVAGGGAPQLLMEQACCGAWSPDGWRIAYIDLSGGDLVLEAVTADGGNEETLLAPLTYGRGAYPADMLDWVDPQYIAVPLEVIGDGGLDLYRDVFTVNLWENSLDDGLRQDECAVLSRDVVTLPGNMTGGLLAEAIAFERAGATCNTVMQSVTAPKGVDLVRYDAGDGRELPWLAAPSLSADGIFMAAERYSESDDPSEAELWGVVVVDTAGGTVQEVATGAMQPAWRPAPALDPAALRLVQPGERLVTLSPPLEDGGKLYRISYMTTGDIQRHDGGFFHVASPEFLTNEKITGIVVTADGALVTDPATLRRVTELYHAAYHLYFDPLPDLVPPLGEELDKVLANPLLMAMEPEKFLTSSRNQTAAALRAMLTAPGDASGVLDAALANAPANAQEALDALDTIIEDQHASNATLAAMQVDLEAAYQASRETAEWGENSLKLLRLAADLIYLSELQSERAGWLQTYVDAFASGEGSLDRDQLRAAASILEEVGDARQQRVDLVVDFLAHEATDTLLRAGAKLSQQAAADLVAQLAAKYGASISSQAVASLLSAVSVGLTVNGVLYGTDDLVANYQLASRAEALRAAFRAAIDDVEIQVALRASADQPPAAFDGIRAEAYRTAVLLDALAGVTAQRAYADGVAASERIPNLLTLINTLRGEDWEAAVEGLRKSADEAERGVLGDLAGNNTIDAVVALAVARVGDRLMPELDSAQPDHATPSLPREYRWIAYQNPETGEYLLWMVDLQDPNNIFTVTPGMEPVAQTGEPPSEINGYVQVPENELFARFGELSSLIFGVSPEYAYQVSQTTLGIAYEYESDIGVEETSVTHASSVFTDSVSGTTSEQDSQMSWGIDSISSAPYVVHGIEVSIKPGELEEWITYSDSTQVNDVLIADQILWLATSGGLIRWDLTTNEYTRVGRSNGVLGLAIRMLHQSSDGSLWAATDAGVSHLNSSGEWTTITTEGGLADNDVTIVTSGPEGDIWAGTKSGISHLERDGRWTVYTTNDGLPSNTIADVFRSADGTLNFVTDSGLVQRTTDDSWYTRYTWEYPRVVYSFYESDDESLWFGGPNPIRIDSNGSKEYGDDDIPGDAVFDIAETSDGITWFATDRGLTLLDRFGEWHPITADDGISFNVVNRIFQSSEAEMWFATDGGASRLEADGTWTHYVTAKGLSSPFVNAVHQTADGAMWFGTTSGLDRLGENGTMSTVTDIPGLSTGVEVLFESTAGDLWVGTSDSGAIRRSASGIWEEYTVADGLPANRIQAISQTNDGSVWFGTPHGASRFGTDGRWTSFTAADGLPHDNVLGIQQGIDGTIWLATQGGIGVLLPSGQWQTLTSSDGLPGDLVNVIYKGKDNRIYFSFPTGTDKKLGSVDPDMNWNFWGATHPVQAIFQSSDGYLWFGKSESGGIGRVDPELQQPRVDFNTLTGLADNNVEAIYEGQDGVMWFATQHGVTRYKRPKEDIADLLRPIYPSKLELIPYGYTRTPNGDGWSTGTLSFAFTNPSDEVTHGTHFDFTAAYVQTTEGITYPVELAMTIPMFYGGPLAKVDEIDLREVPDIVPPGFRFRQYSDNDEQGKYSLTFRFAEAAHPVRIIVPAENLEIDLVEAAKVEPSYPADESLLSQATTTAKFDGIVLADDPDGLLVTLKDDIYVNQEIIFMNLYMTFDVVNRNSFEDREVSVELPRFLAYFYTHGRLESGTGSPGSAYVSAGPAQVLTDKEKIDDLYPGAFYAVVEYLGERSIIKWP